jgi:tRNA(Ile)-lysidine synthase
MKPEDFSDAVRKTAERYGMDLSRPLALVSGGPDSVALLRALVELGGEPVVLHLDHGLRGEESREDAEFVRALCEKLGVQCDVRSIRLEEGPNLQERARDERYRLAEEVAGELGLQAIAVGHTADDVAETVLMNLARGTGLRGLAGIPPVRGRMVRPLIRHRRREVLHYLKYLIQAYRTDPTNLTGKYTRNRVRLDVLPILEELYPGATSNIAHGAALASEDLEVLEGLAAGAVHQRGGEVVVLLDDLRKMPPALQRHAVRRAYSTLEPETASLDSATVEGILKLIRKKEGTRMMYLPGYVIAAIRFGEELALYHGKDLFSGEEDLLVGKQGFDRWVIEVSEVQEFDAADAARPEVAYLDAVRGPYRVRMAREGDNIRPLGLGGTKKVLRAMMDRKVPKDLRRRTPVIVDASGEVAWIFLGELGEEFKVDEATERMLRLEVEKIP